MNRLRPWLFISLCLLASVAMAETIQQLMQRYQATDGMKTIAKHTPLVVTNKNYYIEGQIIHVERLAKEQATLMVFKLPVYYDPTKPEDLLTMQRTKQDIKEYRPIVVVLKDGEFAGLKLEDLASDTTYTVFGTYIANQEIYSNDSRKFPVLQALGIYEHNYIEREMRREQENIMGIFTGTVNTIQQFTEAATTLNTPNGGQTYLRQMPSITGPRSGNSTPATAAATSDPKTRSGTCLLEVQQRKYLDGPCSIRRDSDGGVSIETKPLNYFAIVDVTDGQAQGHWNAEEGANHAHNPLGVMVREGACWQNAQAKVCAWTGDEAAGTTAAPSLPPGVSAYTGAWFRIQYPSTFTVRPSLHSETTDRGYDSAFFTAPDDSVEFYVFSPQWTGEPTDIALRPATETALDRKQETKAGKTVTWVSIKAKDGSYTRAYVDTEEGSTRLVFGIQYRNQAAYERYRAAYVQFKQSLEQFADGLAEGEE